MEVNVKRLQGKQLPVHFLSSTAMTSCQVFIPASADHTWAGVLKDMMLTWSLRCSSSSLNCFWLQLQSAKISTSLATRRDTRDSMCLKFTCFSCRDEEEMVVLRCDGGQGAMMCRCVVSPETIWELWPNSQPRSSEKTPPLSSQHPLLPLHPVFRWWEKRMDASTAKDKKRICWQKLWQCP